MSRSHGGHLGLCGALCCPPVVSLLASFQPLVQCSLSWELTCASPIFPSRTHPPAPGNAAAPERLEALKYQRIKKPKKSSKGSSKSKKRSGKWWRRPALSLPSSPCHLCVIMELFGPDLNLISPGCPLELNPPVHFVLSFLT